MPLTEPNPLIPDPVPAATWRGTGVAGYRFTLSLDRSVAAQISVERVSVYFTR